MGADGNKRKMLIPVLVRQVRVIYPDKNSHRGNLGERKKLFTHLPSKVMAVASMPHGCLGLELHKSGTSRKNNSRTTTKKPRVKKDKLDTPGIYFA